MDEEALEALSYFSRTDHPHSHVILDGSGPVILSAPHAVLQTRNGRPKTAERYTGMLCMLLNKKYGIPCIYKSRHINDDANFDPVSPYRDDLCSYAKSHDIRFVLDLHQLAPSRPMTLCIGTGEGGHLLGYDRAVNFVKAAFEKRRLTPVTLDDPFSALMPYTVSASAAAHGIPSLMLELNSSVLMENCPSERFCDVEDAVYESVCSIASLFHL